jgi:hypothetical protein
MHSKSAAKILSVSLPALLLASMVSAQTAPPAEPAAVSKVRIVRLSQVKGEVQLDRANGRGYEPAITNLPVVESSRLETANGVAEVEFEDNSSLRVGPNSIVEFPKLERLPGGTTVSSVHLVKGVAYVSLMKTPGNEFNLSFGEQNLRLPAASHVRLEVGGDEARLAVLEGTVHVESAAGVMDVPRKKSVTFEMNQSSMPTVAKAFTASPFDAWDHNAVEYHSQLANSSPLSGSPYTYGASDMGYYGNFASYGGCGTMWRPYFASAAWEPYGNGAWAWYQGAGYSWVSPYPWGWMPYHSGDWSFCPGTGWGWMPGGSWMGLNNIAAVPGAGRPIHGPILPSHPPRLGELTLKAVNVSPVVRSEATPDSFLFRRNSAGLGIPRDGLGKLEKFSQHANDKGTARTAIYFEASSLPASAKGQSASASMLSLHRGSPPPSESSSSPNRGQSAPSAGSSASGSTSSAHSSSSSSSSGHR